MLCARPVRAWLALVMLGALGCQAPPLLPRGEGCDLNSDCDAPLVCRFEKCRDECSRTRDCSIGSTCLFDETGLGACLPDDERECVLTSDCLAPLVCNDGRCSNECSEDRDCAVGARCVVVDGGSICVEVSDEACVFSSDCDAGLVCRSGGCVEECVEERDCPAALRCEERDYVHDEATVSLGTCVGGGSCVVGESPRCGCPDGGFGFQLCDEATRTFGACECVCMPGALCNPPDAPCVLGVMTCEGDEVECVRYAFAPAGTACPDGSCDGSGSCL